jgi:hypothetical protein
LRAPNPSEFPVIFHGVRIDIFWNCTIIKCCKCCGSILHLVSNFSNQFHFYFSLSYVHYHNLKQREIKIKLV